jgi:hypothetical protein
MSFFRWLRFSLGAALRESPQDCYNEAPMWKRMCLKKVLKIFGLFNKKTWPNLLLALLLSISCLGIGAGLSMVSGAGLNELIIILTITPLPLRFFLEKNPDNSQNI